MTAEATRLARPLSDRMQAARDLPNGARFYRCALQVNPFAYLDRHNKTTTFTSEDDYNEAIIESCLETGIRELVEEILEGGKAAFEMRRSKYGF